MICPARMGKNLALTLPFKEQRGQAPTRHPSWVACCCLAPVSGSVGTVSSLKKVFAQLVVGDSRGSARLESLVCEHEMSRELSGDLFCSVEAWTLRCSRAQ